MTGSRDDQLQALLNVDGVQKATAEKVLLGVQQFKQFLQNHPGIVVVEDHRAVPASAMGLPRFQKWLLCLLECGVLSWQQKSVK